MGLDYHWDKSPADVQKDVFRKQIAFAKRVNLPTLFIIAKLRKIV